MSDTDTQDAQIPDELEVLKTRATQMGIPFHPSIGLDKLREKVNAAVKGDQDPEPDQPQTSAAPEGETAGQKRVRLKKEAHRLVRVRVTCMNPAKNEWPGEIFTVGNSMIGSIKKYVPFNVDEGWHIPHVMYEMLRERQCQIFVNVKSKNGVTVRTGKQIREFAIEVLPDLTKEELHELALRQAASKSID